MSILSSYDQFLSERLLEGLREMKFVLSPRFIQALSRINHEISDKLMELHNDLDSSKKQTFVDICEDKDDSITFIQANKASELLGVEDEEKYSRYDKRLLNRLPLSNEVYKQFRTEVKLGRFINTVFGATTFPAAARAVTSGKPNDVESFVNLYKATFGQDEKFALMKVVKGNDIAYWYNREHYKSDEDGSLGGSCMSDVESEYFDIYCYNSNVAMLILFKNENKRKIKGRAIVWEGLIEPAGRTYMDRIYTNNSGDEQVFKEYAKKEGWLYKSHQGYGSDSYIVDPVDDRSTQMTLMAQLTSVDHDQYPYMDTMAYYNPNNGKISNRDARMTYVLTDTGGDHGTTDYYDENEVWSNYENEDIYESQAKWCEFGQDWVLTEHAIKVWNSGDKYAVPGNPQVVRSYIPDYVDKHFEKARCTWSDYCNTWIFNGSLVHVWMDVNREDSVIDYKKRSGVTYAEVEGENWNIDLCEKVGDTWKLQGEVKSPVNKPRGWHRKREFIDDEGNIFKKGKFFGTR